MEKSRIVKDAVEATENFVRTGMIEEQKSIIYEKFEKNPEELEH